MPTLRRRYWPQINGPAEIDPSSELSSGLLFASCDCWGVEQGNGPSAPTGFVGNRVASPIGAGFGFTGNSTQYARFDTRISVAAADAVTVEAWVIGSSFPSLSSIAALAAQTASTGAINRGAGEIRGILAFTGTAPCDVYAWGDSQDFDTNAPFATNTPQHIVVTKAAGTGAVLWSVYRNGRLLASGNSSNGVAWTTSGPYFYIGARHPSGGAPITGVITKTGFWNRALTAGEVSGLHENPWQVFKPYRARIYSFPSGAGPSFKAAWAKGSNVILGVA